jgi:hypothetical protein
MNIHLQAKKYVDEQGLCDYDDGATFSHSEREEAYWAFISGARQALEAAVQILRKHDETCGVHECHTLTLEEEMAAIRDKIE